jgi:alkylation response protein AidB-like acyl-CoA dehydrogenase
MLDVDIPDRNQLLRRALRVADLGESPERQELRAVVRGYLAKVVPENEVRRLLDSPTGVDREAWRRFAVDQGLVGLCLPEQYGGAGFGFGEMAVVLEELGGRLAFPSYLSTVAMGANLLLLAADGEHRDRYLPAVASGEKLIAVVAGLGAERIDITATASGGQWRLGGRSDFVLDGMAADVILTLASTADGPGLFACDATDSALLRVPLPTLDLTRRQASVTFNATPARLVGPIDALPAALDHVRDLARVALAAEQVGGAATVLESSVGYAQLRHQFGRPIGSFQAIKHACADMLVDLEAARATARFAAWAADTTDASLPVAAAMAQATCGAAYFRLASQSVQIHGGMGFAWEHPAHLYFRRAKSDELLLGDAVAQRARVAELVGL